MTKQEFEDYVIDVFDASVIYLEVGCCFYLEAAYTTKLFSIGGLENIYKDFERLSPRKYKTFWWGKPWEDGFSARRIALCLFFEIARDEKLYRNW